MHELLARVLGFAGAHPAVRAVVLTGSRARADAPADKLSDLDVELYYAYPEAADRAITGYAARLRRSAAAGPPGRGHPPGAPGRPRGGSGGPGRARPRARRGTRRLSGMGARSEGVGVCSPR